MSVDQQRAQLVQKSLKQHIITALTAAGFTDPSDFVSIGNISKESDDVPIVGIPLPEVTGKKTEIGSNTRRHTYLVDIEVKGKTNGQMSALMDVIGDNVNNVAIINFNVYETNHPSYDADAQTVARGQIMDDVRRRPVDEIDHTGRVSFRLRESTNF